MFKLIQKQVIVPHRISDWDRPSSVGWGTRSLLQAKEADLSSEGKVTANYWWTFVHWHRDYQDFYGQTFIYEDSSIHKGHLMKFSIFKMVQWKFLVNIYQYFEHDKMTRSRISTTLREGILTNPKAIRDIIPYPSLRFTTCEYLQQVECYLLHFHHPLMEDIRCFSLHFQRIVNRWNLSLSPPPTALVSGPSLPMNSSQISFQRPKTFFSSSNQNCYLFQ